MTASFLSRMAIGAWLVMSLTQPRAADIDLYAGTGGGVAAPNVLFYLDNTSNWSSNGNGWKYSDVYGKCSGYPAASVATCQGYVNQVFCASATNCSGNPTLTQGQVEIRALKLVLNQVYCQASGTAKLNFNAGVMLMGKSTDAGSPVDGNSVGTSYIRHAIKPMTDVQCTGTGADLTQFLMADLTNIDSKIQDDDFKAAASGEYGAGLYEAFKYFGGWTNPAKAPGGLSGGTAGVAGLPANNVGFGPIRYSKQPNVFEDPTAFTDGTKTTYKSPISDTGSCGNNYIILIGNTFPNMEWGTDQNANPPTNIPLSRLGYSPNQLFAKSPKSSIRFADEWAQFLYTTDVSSAPGKQNVQMFTIDVYNSATDANQSQLLLSMANAGQGTTSGSGYFKVGGDLFALVNALKDVLTQIASVNSVFASAALPVSVNAQGTYLNQVYMGLFRPDEDAQQRWYGNLKQYQFAVTTAANGTKSLYLADASTPVKAAVDTANTGFIQNCAASFWSGDTDKYWETITGSTSACATQTTSLYSDSPDGPIVERGGAAQKLRNKGFAARNLRTCPTAHPSCLNSGISALSDFTDTTVTAIGSLDAATKTKLVNWARGQNTGDGSYNPSGTPTFNHYTTPNSNGVALSGSSTRPTIHGEVVHSTPLAVNYGSATTNDVVVFYGAGDGTLRALDGNQSGGTAGEELWAFIAPEHFAALDRVRTNTPLIKFPNVSPTMTPAPTPKTYFFDGPITGYQNASGAALSDLWIYAAMRRGGNMVYAFDVSTKPGNSSAASQPKFLWKFGCDPAAATCGGAIGESSMGQSWSAPVVTRVKGINVVSGKAQPLVVFGGGYDNCEDNEDANTACNSVTSGKGLFVMDAKKGAAASDTTLYKNIVPSSTFATAGRFVADVTTVDVNGDGYTDLIYAVDTRGNLWRMNTSDPANGYSGYAPNTWHNYVQLVGVVSQWAGSLAERRKFMNAPSVVVISATQALVLLGTGDREKPSSLSNAAYVNNRFFGIKDTFQTVDATVAPVYGYGPVAAGTDLTDLLNVTGKSSVNLAALALKRGYFLDLSTTSTPYEQVVTTPLTIGGITYFNTYQAKSTSTTCGGLGTARGYQLDFQTGLQEANDLGALAPVTYLSQGMPTSPRGGSVIINEAGVDSTYTFCIACGNANNKTILNPTKPNVKLRPNRQPVYRYQRID